MSNSKLRNRSTVFTCDLRALVCITSYGHANDRHLSRLIDEYRRIPCQTHIVVISNIWKDVGQHVELIVEPPKKDPWHLPFAHKHIFASRRYDFDLFIYSEDDTLVTQTNIEAFLRVTQELPGHEIAGFVRFEMDNEGGLYYPDVHHNFHWDPHSIRRSGEFAFGQFTNEHAAVYMLSKEQLRKAMLSGGYLCVPHRGKYNYPESAATDPYTQCGFTKVLCVSHFSDFLVHHLPNKYIGTFALEQRYVCCQLNVLQQIANNSEKVAPTSLLNRRVAFNAPMVGENYYEGERTDLIELLPPDVRSVLSVGCGWGATEAGILRSGRSVVAVPLDSVIASCARARGVEVVECEWTAITTHFSKREFDCLLVSNVLHLIERPGQFLADLSVLVRRGGLVVATVPNLRRSALLFRRLRRKFVHQAVGDFCASGVQFTSPGIMRKWLEQGGFQGHRFLEFLPDGTQSSVPLGVLRPFLSKGIVAVATRRRQN